MSKNNEGHPNAGHWFDLAERLVAAAEMISVAADKFASATERISEIQKKRYELERNQLL